MSDRCAGSFGARERVAWRGGSGAPPTKLDRPVRWDTSTGSETSVPLDRPSWLNRLALSTMPAWLSTSAGSDRPTRSGRPARKVGPAARARSAVGLVAALLAAAVLLAGCRPPAGRTDGGPRSGSAASSGTTAGGSRQPAEATAVQSPEPDGGRAAEDGHAPLGQATATADAGAGEPGQWKTGAALPVAIAEIAAAPLEGGIYTGGGFTPPRGSIGRWFGRYDVARDRWQPRAELPVAVHHPGLAAADGRVWLAGGYTGRLRASEATVRLDAYDPAADQWTRMADMPGPRGAHFLVALGDELYVVGGVSDAPEEMWVYDIATDRWSRAPGPTPREHLGAAAIDGRLYVVAGRGFGHGIVGTLEAYDPTTGQWSTLASMPSGCGGCSAAATADGRLHVTGGEGGGRTYDEHYVYHPSTDTWTMAAPLPTARHGIGTAAVGRRFYVIGGGRQQGLDYSTVVEWWAPSDVATATPMLTPTAAASPTPVAGRLWLPRLLAELGGG